MTALSSHLSLRDMLVIMLFSSALCSLLMDLFVEKSHEADAVLCFVNSFIALEVTRLRPLSTKLNGLTVLIHTTNFHKTLFPSTLESSC